jgi:hypothetical protein
MDIDRLRHLLPFFVAGTLEAEERRDVEEALRSSEELRQELKFWERAKTVVAARMNHAAAGHLTVEQIVDRAMGTGSLDELLSSDRHLQSCSECSEEFIRVKESLGARDRVEPDIPKRFLGMVRTVRLIYAVPVLMVVFAVVVLYFGQTEKPLPDPTMPGVNPPAIAEGPAEQTASLWLTYRPEVRSTSVRDLPFLALGERENQIRVFVAIPQNQVSGIQYKVTVGSPGTKLHHLDELLKRYASGGGHDSLQFMLPRQMFPSTGHNVTITVLEVLPPALRSLSPEEYHFEVEVRVKR